MNSPQNNHVKYDDNSNHASRVSRGTVRKTVLALTALVAVVVGLTFYKYLNPPPLTVEQLQAMGTVVFTTPRSFQLEDMNNHNNQPFTHQALTGGWTLMYFGYTFCPDICPLSLGQMNKLNQWLQVNNPVLAAKTRYVMVTVDPARDTAEKLKTYLPHFNPDFVGVTGGIKGTHDLARQLNVAFTPVIKPDDEFYLVDHSANLIIINPKGDYHGFIRPPLEPEKLGIMLKAVDALYQG